MRGAGTPWCELEVRDAQLLADLGRKLASLDRAFGDFAHPAMHRTHRWDLTALHRHRGKASLVDDRERRRTLEWAFDLWASCRPGLAGLPASYIHADANDENLLVEHSAVTGLLDFGDGLYNPVVCDLAIALAYAMLDRDDPLDAGSRVVAAYHNVRPLAAAELEVLFPLVCGRLANTVSVAAERRGQDARHPNWFVTEGGAWLLLGTLGRWEPAEALARLISLVPGRA